MKTNPPSTSPERWNQISDILQQLIDVSDDQQSQLLDQLCGANHTLKKEVLSFLDAHHKAGDFLKELDDDRTNLLLTEDEPVDQEIGPYRIKEELGRGGMGVVYLAERSDGQFEQQVALKLIKRGMDSDAIEQRFLHERQILARLQHPNIARLLDGNITEDGQPYFAMEYIDGEALTSYCDRQQTSIEERLRLFGEVAKAVQYAHANLVVHRDLKPSNMLVDEAGQLKLLDFGIAKVLTGEHEPASTALTTAGTHIMTPEYAAPEQLLGEPVTISTDVYALGVVLYELLTGLRPYETNARSPQDLAKAIHEYNPPAPSTIITITTEDAAIPFSPDLISKQRATSIDKLRRQLAGDLDTIVLKAIHKDQDRRYPSVEALFEDIKKHSAGLPVSAQRDSVLYRFSKFSSRHKAGVIAAILILLSLGAGISTTIWQAARANRERDAALLETEKAKQVTTFMADLFQTSDPAISRGNEITVREMLDSGAVRIDRDLRDQPEVRAQMMDAIGRAYFGLGLYDKARPMLEKGLLTRQNVAGINDLDVAESHYNLAYLLSNQGYYKDAETHYKSSLDIRKSLLKGAHPDLIKGMNGLAYSLRRRGQFAASETLYRESLDLAKQSLQREDPEYSISLNGLAASLRSQGKSEEAEPILREALALNTEIHGENHPHVAVSLYNLANLLHEQQEHEEAKVLYENTIALESKLFGERHPTIAIDLGGLAKLHFDLGDYLKSESIYNRALDIQREALQDKHPRIATTLIGLSKVYMATSRPHLALELIQEALAIRKASFVAGHWLIGEATSTLGLCYRKLDQPVEAEKYLINGFELLKSARGLQDSHTQTSLNYLLQFYESVNLPEKAKPYLQLKTRVKR